MTTDATDVRLVDEFAPIVIGEETYYLVEPLEIPGPVFCCAACDVGTGRCGSTSGTVNLPCTTVRHSYWLNADKLGAIINTAAPQRPTTFTGKCMAWALAEVNEALVRKHNSLVDMRIDENGQPFYDIVLLDGEVVRGG